MGFEAKVITFPLFLSKDPPTMHMCLQLSTHAQITGNKKKILKAFRHHLIKHTHFPDNSFLFSGTDIFLFPLPVGEIEASFSIRAQWSNSSPTTSPEGESCPRHTSRGSFLKPAVPAVPSTSSLPPPCRSWAFPMRAVEALPVQAPTTPWAPRYPSDSAWDKLDAACQKHSVSSMGVVTASRQNQQEGFWGDSRATSTACSAVGATFKQKGGEKQLSSFGSNSRENIKEAQAITGNLTSCLKAKSAVWQGTNEFSC